MITTTIETITPEKAQEYLERNVRNRVINSRSVDSLVRDIKAGSFYLTHQGIAFYDDGTLADGQHRLTAIVLAGRPVQMMVTRYMPHDTKIAIDYGMKRGFEDSVDIEGGDDRPEFRSKKVTAAIRSMFRVGYNPQNVLTNHEIRTLLQGLEKEVGILYRASISRTHSPIAMVNAAALAAAVNGECESDLHSFFSVFALGDASKSGDCNIAAAYNWSKKLTEARLKHITIYREQVYRGTQNAIWQYIHGDAQKTIKIPKVERYPVYARIDSILKGE